MNQATKTIFIFSILTYLVYTHRTPNLICSLFIHATVKILPNHIINCSYAAKTFICKKMETILAFYCCNSNCNSVEYFSYYLQFWLIVSS